jgi:hypothetical protein
MRNKHGGACYRCGRWVAPGTGHFERRRGGWRVQHALHAGRGAVTCEMAAPTAETVIMYESDLLAAHQHQHERDHGHKKQSRKV